MTYDDRKSLIIYLVIFIYGLSLMAFVLGFAADYTGLQIVVYIILGIILMTVSVILIARRLFRIRHYEKSLLETDKIADADADDTDRLTSRFLKDYSLFWNSDDDTDDLAIRSDVTQLFYNMLQLHRDRLARLNIREKFLTVKRKYADFPNRKDTFKDGNYDVTQAYGQIEAVRCYYAGEGKDPFYVRRNRELAHYRILSADRVGEEEIHCPNCGCITTREKLLDGCEYCGTKFVIEDLGSRISGFAMRDDADLAYAKYKENRIDRAFYAFYIAFAVMYVFVYLCMLILMSEPYAGDSDPMNPLFGAFSLTGVTAAFAAIMAGITEVIYLFVICPISEIGTAISHSRKKQAEILRESRNRDGELEKKIREYDPLFSMQAFYLGVQNKLSSIIYSSRADQINAFMTDDRSELLDKFKNTFDMDVLNLAMTDYDVDETAQKTDVEAHINCYEQSGHKTKIRYRIVKMHLIKAAECRTQSVCEPYVLRCRNCGSSLSLAEGLLCPNCGTKADLFKYDWVIDNIECRDYQK